MMKKETLIKFIDKYSLGGNVEAVTWKVVAADKLLRVRGELEGKTFTVDLTLKDFIEIAEDVRIPIKETAKVRLMLSPFGEDINLTLNKNGDRVLGFTVTNQDCESYCSAAEPTAIPPVTKDLTDKATYDVEIALTEEFVGTFLKAKKALSNVDEFMVRMNKSDKLEFVLGFSTPNADRINILAPTINGKDKYDGPAVRFPAKYFVEVLQANQEFTDGVLYFHPGRGVLKAVYKSDTFECLYWQFALNKK